MDAARNKQIVQDACAAFGRGDIPGLAHACFDRTPALRVLLPAAPATGQACRALSSAFQNAICTLTPIAWGLTIGATTTACSRS